jgi:hypothetical protein
MRLPRVIQIPPTISFVIAGVAALRDTLKLNAPKLQMWMFFLFGVGGTSLVVVIFREHSVVTSFRYILTKGCSLRGVSHIPMVCLVYATLFLFLAESGFTLQFEVLGHLLRRTVSRTSGYMDTHLGRSRCRRGRFFSNDIPVA